MKLLSTRFGDVGMGTIVKIHPMGQWLGVDIPLASMEFILLRPTIVKPGAEDLSLDPYQRASINWWKLSRGQCCRGRLM